MESAVGCEGRYGMSAPERRARMRETRSACLLEGSG